MGLSGLLSGVSCRPGLAAGGFARPQLRGISTCCCRSWGLAATSIGPLGPHIALWRWYCQRGRALCHTCRFGCGLPARMPPGGGWGLRETIPPFVVRRGAALTPLPTPESALPHLSCGRRTSAIVCAQTRAGLSGLEPAGGLVTAGPM